MAHIQAKASRIYLFFCETSTVMEIVILHQSCLCIRVSTQSYFCHLLAITGALGVHMGDADLGSRVLADEVEDVTQ